MNLDFETFAKALAATEILKRRESLVMLKLNAYPNASLKDQKDIHHSFHKIAYPNNEEKILTTADLIKNGAIFR